MILNDELRAQTLEYLKLLEKPICFTVSIDDSPNSQELDSFVKELCSLDERLTYQYQQLEYTPSFTLNQTGQTYNRVTFAGTPLGHEYSSFILALLQVGGRTPKITQQQTKLIQSIQTPLKFKTYVSLTCHNCPDVVQALNTMSVLNPNISHTMIDGAVFQDEVNHLEIMAVPTVYLNDEIFTTGKNDLDTLLEKLGQEDLTAFETFTQKIYDVLIIGGGPAGASSAIYAARKGLKVGVIAKEFGGQVNETKGIENIIGTPYIEGADFAAELTEHMQQYDIDFIKSMAQTIKPGKPLEVILNNNLTIKSKTVIITTGASWRKLNIPGEQRLTANGVAYCTHCDAPLFKNKKVAVIGGGNSGVEAAIDLAGLASEVTLLEFAPTLKADQVLQDRIQENPKVNIITNAQTVEITGTKKVDGLLYVDRKTNEEHQINLDGVFIQIGLQPNTDWIKDVVHCNDVGEIITDENGQTNVEGIYAAGDCTNSKFKQIVISMGDGSNAALSAFDYLIRHQ